MAKSYVKPYTLVPNSCPPVFGALGFPIRKTPSRSQETHVPEMNKKEAPALEEAGPESHVQKA